jgi:predicted thioesterase
MSAPPDASIAQLVPGLTGRASWDATERHSAEAWGSGAVPVFSTPSLVGLMEAAAMDALAGRLGDGQTTVGTRIDVSHLAATPLGDRVRAEAVLVSVDGRRLVFDLVAHDSRQRIGEGRHERVVVARERFLAKLARS